MALSTRVFRFYVCTTTNIYIYAVCDYLLLSLINSRDNLIWFLSLILCIYLFSTFHFKLTTKHDLTINDVRIQFNWIVLITNFIYGNGHFYASFVLIRDQSVFAGHLINRYCADWILFSSFSLAIDFNRFQMECNLNFHFHHVLFAYLSNLFFVSSFCIWCF